MKKLTTVVALLFFATWLHAQQPAVKPCTLDPGYRQFDFWIGDWDVFAPTGKPAGQSHVELILDSCILLENWQSAGGNYTGKSFNSYDSKSKTWKQNWVDDKGGGNDYYGQYADDKMIYTTKPFSFKKDTMAIRRMTFFHISDAKVRQLGEITKDSGTTWAIEYDLEYRRRI